MGFFELCILNLSIFSILTFILCFLWVYMCVSAHAASSVSERIRSAYAASQVRRILHFLFLSHTHTSAAFCVLSFLSFALFSPFSYSSFFHFSDLVCFSPLLWVSQVTWCPDAALCWLLSKLVFNPTTWHQSLSGTCCFHEQINIILLNHRFFPSLDSIFPTIKPIHSQTKTNLLTHLFPAFCIVLTMSCNQTWSAVEETKILKKHK